MADVLMVLAPAAVRGPEGSETSVTVVASYTACCPWEVALTVMTVEHEAVTWSLHREVVRQGLDTAAGRCDAVVAPLATSVVAVGLAVPGGPDAGEAVLDLPRSGVAGLLAACDRVVPPGAERVEIPDSPAVLVEGGAS